MGGRGSSSGISSDIKRSENIKNQMISAGLSSKFVGIRQKAEQGTGNYAFKSATAVNYNEAKKLKNTLVHERNGNTLIEGYKDNGKHVYYANKSESAEIKSLLEKRKVNQDVTLRRPDMTGKTTTTYDRWLKNNRKKFDDYYFGAKGKK